MQGELDPLVHERAARPALADDAERDAAELAARALADDLAGAASVLDRLRAGPHTGLADNGEDLLNAASGAAGYAEHAERMLDDEDLDPALRLRLETYLEQQPLRSAARSLADDRRYKAGAVFNRVVEPLSRISAGAALNPIGTVLATVASIRVLTSFAEITPRERKALRDWEEFLLRNPDAPEAVDLARRIEHYKSKRVRYLHDKALEAARRAYEARSPQAATAHLDRADRLVPDSAEAARLRRDTNALREARRLARLGSYETVSLIPEELDAEARRALETLAVALMSKPASRIAGLVAAWRLERRVGPLSAELDFAAALAPREAGDEDAFTEQLAAIARAPAGSMARHARAFLASPAQNPHAFYLGAVRADRRERTRWLLFGRRSRGPTERGLRAPVEAVLNLPSRLIALAVSPIRWLRYPGARRSFGDGVLLSGESYLERFPRGVHAAEVHHRLEKLYAQRARWIRALEHHEAGERVDARRVARYRQRIAAHTLLAAEHQPRIDVQVALLRAIISDYADTDAADAARVALREVMTRASAQRIRVSRNYLLEFPELWGPRALGLRPELLDEERGNGEIGEDGIFLLGRNYVEISLEGRDPLVRAIPEKRFARFVALLEESSYRQLTTDDRERAQLDPQRDLFFERARLGLLDTPDLRPTARSQAEFLSTQEKHGGVMSRESILPVELVVRGDLDRLGLAAFPRIRLPREDANAFLYE
ncbi:MAG: hypothetical protein V3V67_15365 [Myxococcota bacterium]